MKKLLFVLSVFLLCINIAKAAEPVVKIEIPASSVQSIDVNYEKTSPSKASQAMEATKEAADKTVSSTKKFTKKTVKATKSTTKKAVKSTKDITDKTVTATKKGYHKTIDTTKDLTDKTKESAKDVLDSLNPNKPVTLEGLEAESEIRILKNEKNGLKSAYNSRIKDIDAKIKAAEKATNISDVQKRNKVYTLNKEKLELINQRDAAMAKYNKNIEKAKEKAKNK